jgi:biopolymer transport protein ExbB
MGTGYNWIEVTRTSVSMMALIAFSIVSLGVVLERLHYYWKRGGKTETAMEQVLRAIREGDIRGAARICRSCTHPMGAVGAQMIENGKFGEEEAEEPLQIALSEQKLLLERNLGILGTIAAVAPLVGLLGTVTGIMRAFNDMSVTGSGSPSVVAAGVAEALITTAIGIMIAVPVLMAYNAFARRMNVMLTIAENNVRSMRSALAGGADGRPAVRASREGRPRARETAEAPIVDELEPVR